MEEITQCSSAHSLGPNTEVSAGGAPGTSVGALQQPCVLPDQRNELDKEHPHALLS